MNVIQLQVPPRYNLDTSAMLVEFNASVWTARKLDRAVSDEVMTEKHAGSRGAARVNKNLLAGRGELEKIQKFVAGVRNWLYTNTLPWSDSGLRLLPATQFVAFDAKMQEFESEFRLLVADFVIVYPTLITAQALALGQMFDRGEYPPASTIASKFAFGYNFVPVPSAGDFRVDVGNEAQRELQEKLEQVSAERLNSAMRDLWERLHEHLTRMSDRLKVDVVAGEEKPRRFHDTLVTGGAELCDMLDALNVTRDTELERASKSLRQILDGKDADTLRKDLTTRESTLTKVDELLSKLNF